MIHGYPKIWQATHRQVWGMFNENAHVYVQEKLDGSQISFGLINGKLHVRSKGQQIDMKDPNKMFARAIESLNARKGQMVDGFTYRGEYLQSEKHNVIRYGRVPPGHIVIFDVQTPTGDYLRPVQAQHEASFIGLEFIQSITTVRFLPNEETLARWMDIPSMLGGKMEGLVMKNYEFLTPMGDVSICKVKAEWYKKAHGVEWKTGTRKDRLDDVAKKFVPPMLWENAWEHLRDAGKLTDSLADIGPLMKEVQTDAEVELLDDMKERLWQYFRKDLLKRLSTGLPEWYKAKLASMTASDTSPDPSQT